MDEGELAYFTAVRGIQQLQNPSGRLEAMSGIEIAGDVMAVAHLMIEMVKYFWRYHDPPRRNQQTIRALLQELDATHGALEGLLLEKDECAASIKTNVGDVFLASQESHAAVLEARKTPGGKDIKQLSPQTRTLLGYDVDGSLGHKTSENSGRNRVHQALRIGWAIAVPQLLLSTAAFATEHRVQWADPRRLSMALYVSETFSDRQRASKDFLSASPASLKDSLDHLLVQSDGVRMPIPDPLCFALFVSMAAALLAVYWQLGKHSSSQRWLLATSLTLALTCNFALRIRLVNTAFCVLTRIIFLTLGACGIYQEINSLQSEEEERERGSCDGMLEYVCCLASSVPLS